MKSSPFVGTQFDVVVLLSGGLDSTIAFLKAKHEHQNVLPLHIGINAPYAHKEKEAVETLAKHGIQAVTIDLPLFSPALQNAVPYDKPIIVGRNVILSSIAASFGERVWVSSLLEEGYGKDGTLDKQPSFYKDSSKLFSTYYGFPVRVSSPFQDMTKYDMLDYAMKLGVSRDIIEATSSCYHPVEHSCGRCGACLKRQLALAHVGMEDYDLLYFMRDTEMYRAFRKKVRCAHSKKDYSRMPKRYVEQTIAVIEKLEN